MAVAAQVVGRVARVAVKEGSEVVRGELLIELDASDARAALALAGSGHRLAAPVACPARGQIACRDAKPARGRGESETGGQSTHAHPRPENAWLRRAGGSRHRAAQSRRGRVAGGGGAAAGDHTSAGRQQFGDGAGHLAGAGFAGRATAGWRDTRSWPPPAAS
ncbi:MAG: biotin/lipoyl-binding protein [Rhodanobacteraceae bacterium]|nr:biotin/lipoyl-binding protein [Rhodanobacteraceae bacterium]